MPRMVIVSPKPRVSLELTNRLGTSAEVSCTVCIWYKSKAPVEKELVAAPLSSREEPANTRMGDRT